MNLSIKTHRKAHRQLSREHQIALFTGDLLSNLEFHASWTVKEVKELKLGLIKTSLEEIKDRRKSPAMRKEAWDWIMNDDDAPFSARECASENDLDIDNLRRMLRRLIKDI